jgi:hypothetical protein
MVFFDERGGQIFFQEWLKIYEQYYFLGGPKMGRKINGRNQSSRFVEDSVCSLLSSTSGLSKDDLIRAMAWKIGLINHQRSETLREFVYRQDWPVRLTAKLQFRTLDFSRSLPALALRMPVILAHVESQNPRNVFDLGPQFPGFGNVYILTVLFFASQGRFPIYDKYAHVGAIAIQGGLLPGSHIDYKGIQRWRDYEDYMGLLAPLAKACPQAASSMLVSRSVDRSLWVYGHFFRTEGERVC